MIMAQTGRRAFARWGLAGLLAVMPAMAVAATTTTTCRFTQFCDGDACREDLLTAQIEVAGARATTAIGGLAFTGWIAEGTERTEITGDDAATGRGIDIAIADGGAAVLRERPKTQRSIIDTDEAFGICEAE